jgi:hypothetical protein
MVPGFVHNLKPLPGAGRICTMLLWLLLLPGLLMGGTHQSRSGDLRIALRQYERGDFGGALEQCRLLLQASPADYRALYLAAECHRRLDHLPEAEFYYGRVVELARHLRPLSVYYLALTQKWQGKFEEARPHFEQFLEERPDVPVSYFERAHFELRGILLASDHRRLPGIDFQFAPLPAPVNSEEDERQPLPSDDGRRLSFLSGPAERPHLLRAGQSAGGWQWSPDRDGLSRLLENRHVHSGTFSPGGDAFLFSLCLPGEEGCGLYRSQRGPEGWAGPEKLGEGLHGHGRHFHQPALSAGGDTLFFASDRPGGRGGFDLWYAVQDGAGGWADPVNLGSAINTAGDECSPHFRSHECLLFFASDGHIGFGRLDLFYTRWPRHRPEVINLGRPFNSGGDDSDLVLGGDWGFMASNRGGPGPGWEIYRFNATIPEAELLVLTEPELPSVADAPGPELVVQRPAANARPGTDMSSVAPPASPTAVAAAVIIVQRDDPYHLVRPGENLTGIARRYGLSKQELLDLNGQRSLRLQEGQRLLIRAKISP